MILLITKAITARIITTKKTPTPTPALNIPSIKEQPETNINSAGSISIAVILFFISSWF